MALVLFVTFFFVSGTLPSDPPSKPGFRIPRGEVPRDVSKNPLPPVPIPKPPEKKQ